MPLILHTGPLIGPMKPSEWNTNLTARWVLPNAECCNGTDLNQEQMMVNAKHAFLNKKGGNARYQRL